MNLLILPCVWHSLRWHTHQVFFWVAIYRVCFDIRCESHYLFWRVDFLLRFTRDVVVDTIFIGLVHFRRQQSFHSIPLAVARCICFFLRCRKQWACFRAWSCLWSSCDPLLPWLKIHTFSNGPLCVVILHLCRYWSLGSGKCAKDHQTESPKRVEHLRVEHLSPFLPLRASCCDWSIRLLSLSRSSECRRSWCLGLKVQRKTLLKCSFIADFTP